MYRRRAGVTLVELLFTIGLLGILVLYFSALEQIGRHNFTSIDRKVTLQNQAAYVLERVAQKLRTVVGDRTLTVNGNPANPIFYNQNGLRKRIKFTFDNPNNPNGQWDGIAGGDNFGCIRFADNLNDLEYREFNGTAAQENNYRRTTNANCANRYTNIETLASNVEDVNFAFIPTDDDPSVSPMTTNYIEISVTLCYDINNSATCGSDTNPHVTMTTRVAMPMVSLN